MKKLVGLIALLLLGSGLVTVAAPAPSQAACPYTNCFPTRVAVAGAGTAVAKRRAPYTYSIAVKSNRGSGRPNGALLVTVKGAGVDVTRFYPNYRGGTASLRLRFPRAGRVAIRARFSGDGAWKNSAGAKSVRVVRR